MPMVLPQRLSLLRNTAPAGIVGLGLLVAACARPEMAQSVAYQEADHRAFIGKGTAAVDGEGFLRRPNAQLARCSGGKVFLMPATPYFRERMEIFRKGGVTANSRDRLESDTKVVRQTQCDHLGRFLFEGLPAGKWFVVTRISFESDGWSDNSTYYAEVETRSGEVSKVILSNPNRIQ